MRDVFKFWRKFCQGNLFAVGGDNTRIRPKKRRLLGQLGFGPYFKLADAIERHINVRRAKNPGAEFSFSEGFGVAADGVGQVLGDVVHFGRGADHDLGLGWPESVDIEFQGAVFVADGAVAMLSAFGPKLISKRPVAGALT